MVKDGNGETAAFGNLAEFQDGLEGLIGLPPLKYRRKKKSTDSHKGEDKELKCFEALEAAMEDEHDNDVVFEPGNYKFETTLREEWQFVVRPDERPEDELFANESHKGEQHKRIRQGLAEFQKIFFREGCRYHS